MAVHKSSNITVDYVKTLKRFSFSNASDFCSLTRASLILILTAHSLPGDIEFIIRQGASKIRVLKMLGNIHLQAKTCGMRTFTSNLSIREEDVNAIKNAFARFDQPPPPPQDMSVPPPCFKRSRQRQTPIQDIISESANKQHG